MTGGGHRTPGVPSSSPCPNGLWYGVVWGGVGPLTPRGGLAPPQGSPSGGSSQRAPGVPSRGGGNKVQWEVLGLSSLYRSLPPRWPEALGAQRAPWIPQRGTLGGWIASRRDAVHRLGPGLLRMGAPAPKANEPHDKANTSRC